MNFSNKIGLFGLADIDQSIILKSDYNAIIKLLIADPSSRNLIYKLLPQIMKNNNIEVNEDLLSVSSDFLYDLLKLGEVELIKRIWQILDNNNNNDDDYVNEKYGDLGSTIMSEDDEQIVIEDYLKSVPMNYDLKIFIKYYLDPDYTQGMSMSQIIYFINRILAAAINVNNEEIVNIIKDYWEEEDLNILAKDLLKMKKLLKIIEDINIYCINIVYFLQLHFLKYLLNSVNP